MTNSVNIKAGHNVPEETKPQEEEINPVHAFHQLAANPVWKQEVVLECEKDLFLEKELTKQCSFSSLCCRVLRLRRDYQKLFNPTHLILHEETEDESAKWFAQIFAASQWRSC